MLGTIDRWRDLCHRRAIEPFTRHNSAPTAHG
jgi:hypothetical protein